MRKHNGFIEWHRWIEVATWVLLASIVALLLVRSRFALVPLPIICVLAVVKSVVSLRQDYENYRHKKSVSAMWLFSLIWHIAFAGEMGFFIWVTALLAIASASTR